MTDYIDIDGIDENIFANQLDFIFRPLFERIKVLRFYLI